MADETIEGEVKFGYKEVTLGVADIERLLGRLSGTAQDAGGKLADSLKSGLAALNSQARAFSFDQIAQGLDGLAAKSQAIFSSGIKSGSSFETGINQIQTIANLDPSRLEQFAEQLRTVGRDMGLAVTPAEAAAGAYQILSSNFTDAADSAKVLAGTLKLAEVGGAGQVQSVDLLAGTLNAYGLSADQAASVTDKLFQTVNAGTTTIPELAQSLGLVANSANSAGVSLDELLAALATTTTRGIRTSSSVEGLRGVITALKDPTKEARAEFEALGITVDANTLRQKGLLATLQEIGKATKGNAASLSQIFGAEAANAVGSALLEQGDPALFAANVQKIADSAGAADKAVAIVSKGFEQSLGRMRAAAESFGAGASKDLLPVLTGVVNVGTDAIQLFDQLPGPIKAGALAAVGLSAALAAGAAATLLIAGQVAALNANLLAAGINIGAYVARQVAATALTVQLTAASQGFAGVMQLVATSTLGGIAALTAAGGAVIALALAYKQATDASIEADKAFAKANEGLRGIEGRSVTERFRGDLKGLNGAQLADKGVTRDDLTQEILDARKRAEETDNAKIKASFAEEANRLEEQRRLLDEELKKREQAPKAGGTSSPERQSKEQIKAQKQADDERYKDELQAIELSKGGHQQKIQQLKELLDRYQSDGDKRRQIQRQIAQEEDAVLKQGEQAKQAASKKEEDRRKKLAAEAKKLAQQALQDEQKLADLKEQAAQSEVQRSEQRMQTLDKARERGVNTQAAELAELDKQRKARIAEVDARTNADLKDEKNPKVRAEILRQSTAQKADIGTEFDVRQNEILKRDSAAGKERQQELLSSEKQFADLKIQLLQQAALAGKASEAQLVAAIKERLALQEREIQIQLELAKSRTDDPAAAAAAERQAAASILAARQSATDEIKKGTEALREQKKAKDELNGGQGEFSGRVLSLEQFIQGENERFFGKKDKSPGGLPKDYRVPGIDLKSAENAILKEKIQSPGEIAKQSPVVVGGQFVVEVQLPTGEKAPGRVKSVTLDGRGGDLERSGRGLSGRNGLGGS